MLAGLVIPPAVVPTIFLLQWLGLYKTLLGMIMIEVAFTLPFATLILRAFMGTIPREIDEAAIMDGASPMHVFFSIILPLLQAGHYYSDRHLVRCYLQRLCWTWLVLPAWLGERYRAVDVIQLHKPVQLTVELAFRGCDRRHHSAPHYVHFLPATARFGADSWRGQGLRMKQSNILDNKMTSTTTLNVRIEHLRETLGIGMAQPRLSWMINTESREWNQSAYEIESYDANGKLRDQTGKIESDQSVLVAWPFASLSSREQLSVRVRVWGKDSDVSEWSDAVSLEAGLLSTSDWTAQFITPTWDEDTSRSNPSPYLRREFELRARVKSARLYITSLGLYEAEINGQVVGDHTFAPGWTVYDKRLRYQTFDVTEMLNEGRNALGAVLGDGWFRGRIGFAAGRRNIYGEHLALLAQLEVQYADGYKRTNRHR